MKNLQIPVAILVRVSTVRQETARQISELAKFNGENAFTDDQLAALARFCASENPRFKCERWLDYIAGRYGPNGGSVQ